MANNLAWALFSLCSDSLSILARVTCMHKAARRGESFKEPSDGSTLADAAADDDDEDKLD